MKKTVQSSRLLKPAYGGGARPIVDTNDAIIPLSIFDKVAYNGRVSGVLFYHPPSPPQAIVETGLVKALALYPEWAGRLGMDANGDPVILLNDAGARLVEATADVALSSIPLLEQTPELRSLCASDCDHQQL